MKRVLILGFGVSGRASAALLDKQGVAWVAVDKKGPVFDTADFDLEDVSQVVLSPGVSPSHPIVVRAKERGIEVIGEIELAFRFVKNRCVGVTGSNGKTTTCSLIAHVLKCRAVGNIGSALSEYLLAPDEDEILVVELSSFQLETLEAKKMELGVILNITPNHLDRHSSMEEYVAAKARIGQVCDQLLVSKQVAELFPKALIFDLDSICPEEYIQLGAQNVCAAMAVCAHFGVGREAFIRALATFKKPPHRLEFVRNFRGISYYNDSKATSLDAVMHAVALMPGQTILIAGGVHKGASYAPWIEKFRGKIKKIVAYGQAAAIMEDELAPFFAFERVDRLTEAAEVATKSASVGECVLLSPGCSSYDQFENYEQRGLAFKHWVGEIT